MTSTMRNYDPGSEPLSESEMAKVLDAINESMQPVSVASGVYCVPSLSTTERFIALAISRIRKDRIDNENGLRLFTAAHAARDPDKYVSMNDMRDEWNRLDERVRSSYATSTYHLIDSGWWE